MAERCFADEWARIDAWLDAVRAVAAEGAALSAELLANQRLIRGNGETLARGLDKFPCVMAVAERPRGRRGAAFWVHRLLEAGLKDDPGGTLAEALRMADFFLDETRVA